jgi:hypothetical protein
MRVMLQHAAATRLCKLLAQPGCSAEVKATRSAATSPSGTNRPASPIHPG